ncbi:MAG: RiPP maturation radical SAM C-methyltransferase [Proteobacteria bacterium]|nr:RiPP maturation radical SAM C-methyltransferase [Pseudomonadota bacterium]
MPHADVWRPSAALGILHAILNRDGIKVSSLHGNIVFADQIGIEHYNMIRAIKPSNLFADWIFSKAAFPEFQPECEPYLHGVWRNSRHAIMGSSKAHKRMTEDSFKQCAHQLRSEASRFIHDFCQRILTLEPRIVGCTTTHQQQVASLALLRNLADQDLDIITILGGFNCTAEMGESLHKSLPYIDYVVTGEADDLITPLTHLILEAGRDAAPASLPEGVIAPYHREKGYPDRINAALPGISKTWKDNPVPFYDSYFEELGASSLQDKMDLVLPIQTSRGCWWGHKNQCSFCGFNGCAMQFRSKPGQKVFDEIESLKQRYGISQFAAVDNIMDMRYFKTLVPKLREAGSQCSIWFSTIANLSKAQVKKLCDSGIGPVNPGIESLSTPMLKLMNKASSAWQNIRLLKWCKRYSLPIIWNLLYDIPEDRDEWYHDMADLIPLLRHLTPPVSCHPIMFVRFSSYLRDTHRRRLNLKPHSSYQFVLPFPEDDLEDLVYYFHPRIGLSLENFPLNREGVRRTRTAIANWQKVSSNDPPPHLSMTAIGDRLLIKDGRRSQMELTSFEISGIDARVCLACDDGTGLDNLHHKFNTIASTNDIENTLNRLAERELIVCLDDHVISLPIMDKPPEQIGH